MKRIGFVVLLAFVTSAPALAGDATNLADPAPPVASAPAPAAPELSAAYAHDQMVITSEGKLRWGHGERIGAKRFAAAIGDTDTLKRIQQRRLPGTIALGVMTGGLVVAATGLAIGVGTAIVLVGHVFVCIFSLFMEPHCDFEAEDRAFAVAGAVIIVGGIASAVAIPVGIAGAVLALPTRNVRNYYDDEAIRSHVEAYNAALLQRTGFRLRPQLLRDGGGVRLALSW